METSIVGYLGLGFRKNGEENGNYYNGTTVRIPSFISG